MLKLVTLPQLRKGLAQVEQLLPLLLGQGRLAGLMRKGLSRVLNLT
jgi:hypothetical protein